MPRQDAKKNIILDSEDEHFLNEYAIWIDHNGYAICDKTINGTRSRFRLHRLIFGCVDEMQDLDHKNGNKLDNRKENLHLVSRSVNMSNTIKRKDSSQPFKGIQVLPGGNFSVKVSNGKRIGTFAQIDDAKKCYLDYLNKKLGYIPERIGVEYAVI